MSQKKAISSSTIAKIRDLLGRSTPGEWYAACLNPYYGKGCVCHCGYIFAGGGSATVCQVRHNDPKLPPYEKFEEKVTLDQKNASAELIALLHNNIGAILDELECLRNIRKKN